METYCFKKKRKRDSDSNLGAMTSQLCDLRNMISFIFLVDTEGIATPTYRILKKC